MYKGCTLKSNDQTGRFPSCPKRYYVTLFCSMIVLLMAICSLIENGSKYKFGLHVYDCMSSSMRIFDEIKIAKIAINKMMISEIEATIDLQIIVVKQKPLNMSELEDLI